jgi:hypothetical protein
MGLSTSIALITFAAIHPYWGATWEEQLQLMVLATTLAATLTNLLYLEPKTTQVGYHVFALECYPEYLVSLATTLAATLTNLLYLEPKTTQVGYHVFALECYPEYLVSIAKVGKDSCVCFDEDWLGSEATCSSVWDFLLEDD